MLNLANTPSLPEKVIKCFGFYQYEDILNLASFLRDGKILFDMVDSIHPF